MPETTEERRPSTPPTSEETGYSKPPAPEAGRESETRPNGKAFDKTQGKKH